MSKFYAALDSVAAGNVIGVQMSPRAIDNENLVEIELYDESLVGKIYSKGKFKSSKAKTPDIRHITKGAFYSRLTLSEAVAIEQSVDPVVKVLDRRLTLRSHVDLDLPELVEGLAYMVGLEILTEARVAEMRANGEESERFGGA